MRILSSDNLATIRDPRAFLRTLAKRVMVDLFRRNALEKAYLEMLATLPAALFPSAGRKREPVRNLTASGPYAGFAQ